MTDAETLHAGPPERPGRHPDRVRWWVVALVVLVVGAVGLAGYALARTRPLSSGGVTPPASGVRTSSVPPSPTAGTTLELPRSFGEYVRDDQTRVANPVEASGDVATASAYYNRNGARSVLVIGAEPVYDVEQFLLSIGLSDITPVGDGFCGAYTGVTMCAVLTDGIAVGAVGLDGQGRADLVEIAQQARAGF